jgi:hypothetical protein
MGHAWGAVGTQRRRGEYFFQNIQCKQSVKEAVYSNKIRQLRK